MRSCENEVAKVRRCDGKELSPSPILCGALYRLNIIIRIQDVLVDEVILFIQATKAKCVKQPVIGKISRLNVLI